MVIVVRTRLPAWVVDTTWQGNSRTAYFYQASRGMGKQLPTWPHLHHLGGGIRMPLAWALDGLGLRRTHLFYWLLVGVGWA